MLNKNRHVRVLLVLILGWGPTRLPAELTIDRYTADAGGGASSGGGYTLVGTIGQAEASAPIGAGVSDLTGGFWGGIASRPALEGYAAWAAANIPPAQDSSFGGDANHDGFPNGLAYTFGADAPGQLLEGGLRAPPGNVPADVILTLQISPDLQNWERVLEYANGSRTFIAPDLVIQAGVVVFGSTELRLFYRYVAQLVP